MLEIDIERERKKRKRKIAFVLSCLIPGLGQFFRKRIAAGIFFFSVFFFMVWLIHEIWQFNPGIIGTFAGLLIFHCLNIIDAYKGPTERTAPCEDRCPAGIDISLYIALISEERFDEALKIIRDRMPLPSICGRICYHPCETVCTLRQRGGSLAIESLKRTASDFTSSKSIQKMKSPKKRENVGIIGAGPAGLSAAYFLVRMGYPVTLYEEEKEPGGLLIFGIPEFRLPDNVVRKDINFLKKMGIVIKTGVRVGKNFEFNKLREKHNAILISAGSLRSTAIDIPGKELKGIFNALALLKKVNQNEKIILKGRVAVIGGGNSAFDAARCAIRCGADDVTIFYRRDEKEMPGIKEELDNALKEGVKIEYRTTPVRFLGKDKVEGIEFIRTELIKVKGKKRSRIKQKEGSNFKVDADAVLVATGQVPDFSFLTSTISEKIVQDRRITVNPITMETPIAGIFAAGDIIGKKRTVVDAIEMGRKAAKGIDWFLRGVGKIRRLIEQFGEFDYPLPYTVPRRKSVSGKRKEQKLLDSEKAITSFLEVELGYTQEEAKKEASRCLQCSRR
ncbi:MAG: hypothetical protein E3J87_06160 [Candidatus Cloacimonadota bacterium]|nr:MAG: hypothetical protein E3J87_06160 [Candidatus Cloacimonadota bacterium]